MHSAMRTYAFSCLILFGCGGASASGRPTPEPPPLTLPETVPAPGDDGPERAGCQLETATTIKRRGDFYEVVAWLKNQTNQTLEVDMPDRCPQGAAIFRGLPEGYDYYRSCTKGACMGGRPPIRHSIPAGATIDVEAIEIDPVNANCNRPLEPGRYVVSFAFETPLVLCAGPIATLEHSVPAKPAPARKTKSPCPPMPACGLACPGSTLATDANGCTLCACAEEPFAPRPASPPATRVAPTNPGACVSAALGPARSMKAPWPSGARG